VVGCLGDKREAVASRMLDAIAESRPNPNRDVIPAGAWQGLVVPALTSAGMTTRRFQAALGHAYCGTSLFKHNLSRERAARAARVTGCDELRRLSESDVYWDTVVSVEPDGVEDVFDLTVEGLHNFVADDVLAHNSIEQDADVVMFVYRDEYYDKESERLGEADLILAKHRNGPVGQVTLSFLPKYPKFASLYRDHGAVPAVPPDGAV
jgi:replicative DNA helicase